MREKLMKISVYLNVFCIFTLLLYSEKITAQEEINLIELKQYILFENILMDNADSINKYIQYNGERGDPMVALDYLFMKGKLNISDEVTKTFISILRSMKEKNLNERCDQLFFDLNITCNVVHEVGNTYLLLALDNNK